MIFIMPENVSKFNELSNLIKRFVQTFLSRAMLKEAAPLIIFCKYFHLTFN